MAVTSTLIQNYTDSIAKALGDVNSGIVANSTLTSAIGAIVAEFGGQGSTNTLGRVMLLNAVPDVDSTLVLLKPAKVASTQLAATLTGIQAMNPIFQSIFPFVDALDSWAGGLNMYLAQQSIQVNAWYAGLHNYYATLAVPLQLRGSAPAAILPANFFPYAALDAGTALATWTAGTGTAFAVAPTYPGTSASAGGGIAPMYIYKVNSGAPVGGAVYTINYINAAGAAASTTFTTTSGSPPASGSLAAGVSLGITGSAITSITATGQTTGEQYVIGAKLVRTAIS